MDRLDNEFCIPMACNRLNYFHHPRSVITLYYRIEVEHCYADCYMCNIGCGSAPDYWALCVFIIEDGIIKSVINILPELYFKDNIIKLIYEFVRS